jgi:benzoate-CoA ligase
MRLDRQATPYDTLIYGADWRAWRDPEVPQHLVPTDHIINPARGAHTALIADGAAISYADLHAHVQHLAAGLAALGATPEARLLFFGTDSLDYIATWLAAVQIGLVPVVVSDLYKPADLLYFLQDTDTAWLFLDAEQAAKLPAADQLPTALHTILVRGEATVALANRRIVPLADLPHPGPAPRHVRHANDVTYMFYSGGTTGTAKGITHLAHDFVLVPARQGAFWDYTQDDVVYATSRKYFTHGIWPGVLIPLAHGAAVVLDRNPPRPDVVLDLLHRHRVTKLISVPTVLRNLVEAAEAQSFPALRLVISASEKIPPDLFERFAARFGVEILDSIGSSEIAYEWIANRPAEFRRGSLGKPIFGYDIRLVDDDGNDVTTPDTPGEAWVRSDTSCFFYWRKYRQSRETFIGDWARTGDHLVFDESGFFWFHGRDNDLFKVSGLWISPLEIEAALTAHPAILEAAVVGMADADGLTKPEAWIVLRKDHSFTGILKTELDTAVRRLGGYKIPARYRITEALPRTTLSKIDRKALRQK